MLDTPERVADFLRDANRLHTVEHFQVTCLNTCRRSLGVVTLATGILDSVLTHAREVFACAIALVHNHPSGDPTPSEADIRLTRDLFRAGQPLRIEVADRVILGHRTVERAKDCLVIVSGKRSG